jgi:parvulin-like peptidyl-prolyl isomerase
MRRLLFALSAALAYPPSLCAQPVASYRLGGEARAITFDDLALELGKRHLRTERGRKAIRHLVDRQLVLAAATQEGVLPSQRDTLAWISALRDKVRAAGGDLDAQLARQGMTPAEFESHAGVSLAHERLVRQSLELGPRDAVSPDMLNLWLKEAHGKVRIETDPARLPAGIVARVGEAEIPLLDLGRVLARTADAEERAQFCQQIVWWQAVQRAAAARGATVTPEEAEREVAARRAWFERQARARSIPFEQLLAAEGTSVAELGKWPVLLGQVLERKLAAIEHPDAELTARLRDDREAVLKEFGARRRLHVLLILIPARDASGSDAAQRERNALAEITVLRKKLADGAEFGDVARAHSHDTLTRVAGGDVGWQHRRGAGHLPPEVVDAAFGLESGALSEPVRASGGWWLVRVADVEAAPGDEVVLQRMRDAAILALRRRLIVECKLEMAER